MEDQLTDLLSWGLIWFNLFTYKLMEWEDLTKELKQPKKNKIKIKCVSSLN